MIIGGLGRTALYPSEAASRRALDIHSGCSETQGSKGLQLIRIEEVSIVP